MTDGRTSPSGKTGLPRSAVETGPNTWMSKVVDRDGQYVGINEWHLDAAGEYCGGWVPFMLPGLPEAVHGNHWDVVSFEPLTLSPSLLCTSCRHHGYLRNDRWENC